MKRTVLFLFAASLSFAQAPAPDARGCKDSAVLSRLPGCRIASCKVSDFGVAELPVTKTGAERKKHLEGAYEYLGYACGPETSGVQVFRNAEAAFKNAGYTIVYTNNYANVRYDITVQKGSQWAHVYSDGRNYQLTTLRVKELEQAMQANAEGWAQQINQNGRVSIYGINFDTGKATIRPDSEPVLAEIAALMQKQPDWYLVVAGHTDNVGSDSINLPLSRQRAESVIAWLGAKGIDKSRLSPVGLGARKPLADNATEDGRAKNRRVDLVKLY